MMFQIMVFVIDDIHGLLGLLVLDILVMKNSLHTFQLMAYSKIHPLYMVRINNCHTSKIDQCADSCNLNHIRAVERRIAENKAHIADGKNSQPNADIGKELFVGHHQITLCPGKFPEAYAHYSIDQAIDHNQPEQPKPLTGPAKHKIGIAIDLPFKGCRKLRHHKGTHTHIAHILRTGFTAAKNKQIH